jgi:recombination protein RecR
MTPSVLANLIDALRILPGVGPKSAARMAYHLLQRERNGAARLAVSLGQALEQLHPCERCNNYSETPVCEVCAHPGATPVCCASSRCLPTSTAWKKRTPTRACTSC